MTAAAPQPSSEPDPLSALDTRIRALEEQVAAMLGIPVHGSRDHLIQLGFPLTDESRAWAKRTLAGMKQRHAPAGRPAVPAPAAGVSYERARSLISEADWLAKLDLRVARLEQQLGISAGEEPAR